MDREVIKDFGGRILGYLEHQSNGDIIVKDFYFKILGKYDKASILLRIFMAEYCSRAIWPLVLLGCMGINRATNSSQLF